MFLDLHPTCRVKSQREIPNPNLQIPGNLNRQIPKAAEPRISRITRIWKNCIPNISAIRAIRSHAPWDLGFVIWDLLPQAVSMAENNPSGSSGCDSLARSRVAPAGNP
jgi:hypothetical protein